MSEKCKKCGAEHEWAAHEQLDGSFVVSAGDATISLISAGECGFNRNQARWVGYMLCERICLERQLARAREREATEKSRADKAEAKVKELREILSAWVSRCAEEP